MIEPMSLRRSAQKADGALTGLLALVLVMGSATIAGSTSMATVQPMLLEKLKEARGQRVSVLVVCEDACQSVADALERQGIQIAREGSMDLGTIAAEITADQFEAVKSIPGISALEYDEEAEILAR